MLPKPEIYNDKENGVIYVSNVCSYRKTLIIAGLCFALGAFLF